MIHVYNHLAIDSQNEMAYYLGYTLTLTRAEYGLLLSLIKSEDGTAPDGFTLADGMTAIPKSSVKVHVCNVNKKAEAIGGRRLVVWDEGCKRYFLNEYM